MRSLLTPIGATSHLPLLYDPIFLQEVGDSSICSQTGCQRSSQEASSAYLCKHQDCEQGGQC